MVSKAEAALGLTKSKKQRWGEDPKKKKERLAKRAQAEKDYAKATAVSVSASASVASTVLVRPSPLPDADLKYSRLHEEFEACKAALDALVKNCCTREDGRTDVPHRRHMHNWIRDATGFCIVCKQTENCTCFYHSNIAPPRNCPVPSS